MCYYQNLNMAPDRSTGEILVYPNPCRDILYVRNVPKEVNELHIYDILGNLVKQVNVLDEAKVSTLDLPSGTYIARFISNNGNIFKNSKIIITHDE